jgi:hypothetical protein
MDKNNHTHTDTHTHTPHTLEYYSVIKNNEIISFVGKWVELEIIMLSKLLRLRKKNICLMWNLERIGRHKKRRGIW